MVQFISGVYPVRAFKDHNGPVLAVAAFPDRRRMAHRLVQQDILSAGLKERCNAGKYVR
jgi:hypothetical protein